jgi:hypothetical protein
VYNARGSCRANLMCYTGHMTDAESKKLDQLIVMLADVQATFGERFDKIDEHIEKHDGRMGIIADRLLALEKKLSGVDRRLTKDENVALAHVVHQLRNMLATTGLAKHPEHTAE